MSIETHTEAELRQRLEELEAEVARLQKENDIFFERLYRIRIAGHTSLLALFIITMILIIYGIDRWY